MLNTGENFASNEGARLRALEEYAVFDTPPDGDLDRLVELAARIYGTPVAALSLVGRDRLYFKSRFGMEATGIGREGSFCAFAIESDGLFLVPDASKDPRFATHPMVEGGPGIRFYAGIPLVAPSGDKIGTLCILDVQAWPEFTDADRKNLEDVAALVMNRLELRRVSQAQQGGQQRFERMASTSPDAIIGADAAGLINYWNAAAECLFGLDADAAMGQPIGMIFPEHARKLQTAEVMSLVKGGGAGPTVPQLSLAARRNDGSEFPAELSLSIWNEDDGVGFAAIIRDVAEREQGEQRLFGLAHLDPLTGLPNHSFLTGQLRKAVAAEAGTLLLLDLDGFKDVNRSLGHSTGDFILTETASRLRKHIDPTATVARLGGDEFAILLPSLTDRSDASSRAEELLQLFTTPFAVDDQAVHVGVNIGIAACPAHGLRAEELLVNADLALQRSKLAVGSSYQFFSPGLRRAVVARRSLEAELKRAWTESELELYYQPQVRLSDRSVMGAEALLRWNHPERGLIPPSDFLPVLECSALAPAVGNWVLNTACAEAAARRRRGLSDFRVSVNLFGAQFNRGDLPTRVEEALLQNDLPPAALELEITENIMLRHDEAITVPLREICAWGVGVAFDDYGTGYASLSLLKRYPVTRLKIDRSFVQNICTDAEDAAIVQAIMYLGRRFGLRVIAEGIETEGQDEALRMYGCTEGQGYLYGRPVPAQVFTDRLLRDQQRTVA